MGSLKWWAILGIVVAVLGASTVAYNAIWDSGYQARVAEDMANAVKDAEEVRKTERSSAEITNQVGGDTLTDIDAIAQNTIDLLQETSHASTHLRNTCILPVGLVRKYDAAVLSTRLSNVLDPSGSPDDADSEFTCSDLVNNAISNYGTAHRWRAQVDGWQRWEREQRELISRIQSVKEEKAGQ